MTVEKFILKCIMWSAGVYSITDISNKYKIEGIFSILLLVMYILCLETLVFLYTNSKESKPKELNNKHVIDSLHLEDHHESDLWKNPVKSEIEEKGLQEVYRYNHIHEPKKPL